MHRIMLVVCLLFLFLVGACAEATHYDYLQIPRKANATEIKKTYKKLVLKLHPDKYGLLYPNGTEEELAEMKDMFLKVQMAYEVLSDDDLRMKYDLSLDNPFSAHDFNDQEVNEYNRYVQRIFHLYFQVGKNIRMYGKIDYDRPGVPEIKAQIYVPLKYVFTGYKNEYSFKRRRVCPKCGGMGSVTKECNVCPQCGGAGHCNHLYQRDPERPAVGKSTRSYEHLTETLCSRCRGKGCIDAPVNRSKAENEEHEHNHEKCDVCNGRGTILQDATVPFMLPFNFADGFKANFKGHGHQDTAFVYGNIANYHNPGARRVGDVNLVFFHEYPENMSLKPSGADMNIDDEKTDESTKEATKSYDIIYDATVSIKDMIFSSKVENSKTKAKGSKLEDESEILDNLLKTIDLKIDLDDSISSDEDSSTETETGIEIEIDEKSSGSATSSTESSRNAKGDAKDPAPLSDEIGGLLKKMLAKQDQIRKNRISMQNTKIKNTAAEISRILDRNKKDAKNESELQSDYPTAPDTVNSSIFNGTIGNSTTTNSKTKTKTTTTTTNSTNNMVREDTTDDTISDSIDILDMSNSSARSLNDTGLNETMLNQTEHSEDITETNTSTTNASERGTNSNSTKTGHRKKKPSYILSVPLPTGDCNIDVSVAVGWQ